jgi:hypothetical protein
MTKKDYELIGKAIKGELGTWSISTQHQGIIAVQSVSYRIAELLELENPTFDKERFLKACGTI